MGLSEHIRAGARLTRDLITIADVVGSGSVNLGATYTLLSLQTNAACRFRLYDDIESRDDATEIGRVFPNTNVPAQISLVGDFSMSAAGTYTIDPVLFGHSTSSMLPLSYYRVQPSVSQIQVTRYLLEDGNIQPGLGTVYSQNNRRAFTPITASLAANAMVSGAIENSQIPATYLLISASVTPDATARVRLRLYAKSSSIFDSTEKTRIFSLEPSASVQLIADMILSGSVVTKFSPKIVGVNLQNMGTDLRQLVNNFDLLDGKQELYYVMQNVATVTHEISASLYTYALED